MKLSIVSVIRMAGVVCLSLPIVMASAGATVAQPLAQRVADLESAVAILQQQVAALQSENAGQQAAITALQDTLAAANSVLALSPYLTVDAGKRLVLFRGVNIQLVNGAGQTNTRNGLGNLIVGYDLARNDNRFFCSDGQWVDQTSCEAAGNSWAVSHKTGSHYLVIGDTNNYSQFAGLVVGAFNTSNGRYASVSGGGNNIASGTAASVSGGANRRAAAANGWTTGVPTPPWP